MSAAARYWLRVLGLGLLLGTVLFLGYLAVGLWP